MQHNDTEHKGLTFDTQDKNANNVCLMLCQYAECHYAGCHILFTVMLSVIVLSGIVLSVIMLVVTFY